MPINTYTYKNNCPQGQYRTKENHLIIPTLGISEWVECCGLQILILSGSGLQIQTNGYIPKAGTSVGSSVADCKSLYSVGLDCKSRPTASWVYSHGRNIRWVECCGLQVLILNGLDCKSRPTGIFPRPEHPLGQLLRIANPHTQWSGLQIQANGKLGIFPRSEYPLGRVLRIANPHTQWVWIIQILVKQRLFPQRILPSRWMSPRFRPKNTQ